MWQDKSIESIDKALYFIQKARVACQVRESHLKKKNNQDELTEKIKARALDFEEWLDAEVRKIIKTHPAYSWFSRVLGIGDLNIGKVVALIDIEKASNISKLWRFAGFGVVNGQAERREKGKGLHFSSMLKVMSWRLAKSLIRANGKYADFYHEQKEKLIQREEARGNKVVPSNELPKEAGKHVEKDGFVALGRVDNMAMRKMIKLFLSHLWMIWREAEGLPITKPYAHSVGGHENYLGPWDFVEKEEKSQAK